MLSAKHGGCAVEQDLIDHPHAVSSWQTIRVARGGAITTVVVVETDLVLNATSKDYDKAAVDSLLEAVGKFLESNNHVDVVNIEPLVDQDDDC
jgi:hypothetical protein